jgi:hypothetical protein
MAFNNIDEATSLLIAQLALQDIEEYNRDIGGVGETDEQIAFRLQEEDFESYLREQGLTRDRTAPGVRQGQGQPQAPQQPYQPHHPQPTTAPSQPARPSLRALPIVPVAPLYAAPNYSRPGQPQARQQVYQPTTVPLQPASLSRASSIVSVTSLYAASDHSGPGSPGPSVSMPLLVTCPSHVSSLTIPCFIDPKKTVICLHLLRPRVYLTTHLFYAHPLRESGTSPLVSLSH